MAIYIIVYDYMIIYIIVYDYMIIWLCDFSKAHMGAYSFKHKALLTINNDDFTRMMANQGWLEHVNRLLET